jgi:DNA-binding transcriptional LysR family regulator
MNPSLNAIRTFEAAARHLSFARAARDLAVQPPAVSRKVAELEQQLGVSLFVRSKPRLSLTWQGEALFQSVQRGLDQIQQGCNAVRRQNDQTSLRVLTSIGMAQCWLLARLNGFYQRYPEVDLQLTTRDSTANLDIVGADITITFDDEDEKTKSASCIFYDNIIAVSSPQSMTKKRMLTVSELAD